MEQLPSIGLPGWTIRLDRLGEEKQPLIIIDNFAADPRTWVWRATSTPFAATAPYYPGIRGLASREYLALHMPALTPLLNEVFGFRGEPRITECNYSLVTTIPSALKPPQYIPHFDGGGDGMIALLHYLCPPSDGGTAFFRHRSTGFETVLDKNYEPIYKPALLRDAETFGMPAQRYFRESDQIFERIGACSAAFNRAIIYRGANLHAIDIPDEFRFDPSPMTGRLTVNTFIKMK